MKLVLIGSGNVATILGKRAQKNGHEIMQVVSRELEHAKVLSDMLGCGFADFSGEICYEADLYIISIADKGIFELKGNINLGNKLVVHTAGSVPIEILKDVSSNYGVLYPLQSIRKNMDDAIELPFLITANTVGNENILKTFAESISPLVDVVTDEERIKIHVAAVFVCNFTNHLYGLAEEYCDAEKLDFNMLHPLLLETAQRVKQGSPKNMRTGPAVRKDMVTINRHLDLLNNYPGLKVVYKTLTDSMLGLLDE